MVPQKDRRGEDVDQGRHEDGREREREDGGDLPGEPVAAGEGSREVELERAALRVLEERRAGHDGRDAERAPQEERQELDEGVHRVRRRVRLEQDRRERAVAGRDEEHGAPPLVVVPAQDLVPSDGDEAR